jgi:hypothetical protein
MDPRSEQSWGERLADEGATSVGDERSTRDLVTDAMKVVRDRLGDILHGGIQPLLDEAAAQVRPATLAELRARHPGLPDDEIAARLIQRASRTAAGVAIGIGGMLAAQEAIAAVTAAAPPAGGTALGAVSVTVLAEVLVLFVLEAKLRADLGALAGQPPLSPRDLVSGVVSEVQASGGWSKLRSSSLRRVVPEATARRLAVQVARLIPGRFARIVIPEVVAPLVGSVFAARVAFRQVRSAGEEHWARLRSMPRTTATWGTPTFQRPGPADGHNGGRPPGSGSYPSTWGPGPGSHPGRQELPPPDSPTS